MPAGPMPVRLMPVWPMPAWPSQYGQCRHGQCRLGHCRYGRCRLGQCRYGRCRCGQCRQGITRCDTPGTGRCRYGRCRYGRCRFGGKRTLSLLGGQANPFTAWWTSGPTISQVRERSFPTQRETHRQGRACWDSPARRFLQDHPSGMVHPVRSVWEKHSGRDTPAGASLLELAGALGGRRLLQATSIN